MGKGLSVEDNITKSLRAMATRANSVSSYLNRNLFRQYQKAQIQRWETQGASEMGKWEELSSIYAKRKKKKYAGFPGGGQVIMQATGRLASGATGRDSAYFYKLVTNVSFTIGINLGALPYAIYPGKMRPFMEFSQTTEDEWSQGITEFITRGIETAGA